MIEYLPEDRIMPLQTALEYLQIPEKKMLKEMDADRHESGHRISAVSINIAGLVSIILFSFTSVFSEDILRHPWRNVLSEDQEYDEEMRTIDAMVDTLQLSKNAEHIRSLISRFDAVTHYRSKDNLSLLVDAIRSGTYPGIPAVDVLARYWEIDEKRREYFSKWALILNNWSNGHNVDPLLIQLGENVTTQSFLGELTQEKAWLALSLSKTLRMFVETPKEKTETLEPQIFVRSIYRAALGREPSPDDLIFRVRELASGKTREELLNEIYNSIEAYNMRYIQIIKFSAQP